ncbi:7637_t:CDS:2, partial [Racocetra persica]
MGKWKDRSYDYRFEEQNLWIIVAQKSKNHVAIVTLVEREDSEIEMVLFVPTNPEEKDPETQAVFEKDGFYSIGAVSDVEASSSMISGDFVDKSHDFSNNFVSPNYSKVEDLDNSVTVTDNNELQLDDDIGCNEVVASDKTEGIKKKRQRNANS